MSLHLTLHFRYYTNGIEIWTIWGTCDSPCRHGLLTFYVRLTSFSFHTHRSQHAAKVS